METNTDSSLPRLVAERALRWINSNLCFFDLARSSDDLGHKSLAELALLCLILRRNHELRSSAYATNIADFLSAASKHPRLHEGLHRCDATLLTRIMVHAAIRDYDGAFSSREFLRQQALVANATRCWVEKVPHRLLEVRHILDLAGFEHNLPEWHAAWGSTLLAHNASPLFFSNYESYAITHTLFYLSDFGRNPVKCIPPDDMSNVSRLIQSLLGLYLRRGDFDIAGELLLCERCLRTQPSFMFELGWQLLENEQADDGSLLGPGLHEKEGEAVLTAEQMFRWCYHTTLVAAMAGSVCSDDWKPHVCPKTESGNVQGRKDVVCLSDSLESAQEWMRKMVCTKILPTQTGTKYLMQCLFGLWMCRMMGAPANETEDQHVIARVLDFPPLASPEFDPFEFDPKLLLFCMIALRARGKHHPGLDKFAAMLADVFSQFKTKDSAYAGERLLLHRLGYKTVLPDFTGQQQLDILESPAKMLRLDLPGITSLCHKVETASLYGTIAWRVQPVNRGSLSIWVSVLFETLNSYELIVGSTVLRSMLYMGLASAPEVDQAIDFLLLQQEVDGRFGQLFAGKTSHQTELPPEFDAELDFSLPVTLRCLWTLGECLLPEFRLFGPVFQHASS